jgi:hypothetical protein
MMAVQGHLSDFAIYGNDYDTVDGTAVRDFIHVTDLAAAHVTAVASCSAGIPAEHTTSEPAEAHPSAKSSRLLPPKPEELFPIP